VREVIFVLFDRRTFDAYAAALEELTASGPRAENAGGATQ
jgi:hypothetical protein